jgi:hypothetical protein
MCPVCLANLGFVAASATSASGLAALAVKKILLKWHENHQPNKTRGEENENRNNGTENKRNRSKSFQSRIEGAVAGRAQGFTDSREGIDTVT